MAQAPVESREKSRLLKRTNMGALSLHSFSDIAELLPSHCLLLTNNTQVFSSRLYGTLPSGGAAQIFLLHMPLPHPEGSVVECLGRPHKKFNVGKIISFTHELRGRIDEIINLPSGPALKIVFNFDPNTLIQWCASHGTLPLPPYIKRQKNGDESLSLEDKERYQTVYAKQQGSVAAPTAGLHFTKDIFEILKTRSIEIAEITLHVGGGTFLPVRADDLSKHYMHEETYLVPTQTWQKIIDAKSNNRPIVVVGTTTFRALESLSLSVDRDLDLGRGLCDTWQRTRLFIRPETEHDRYKPAIADMIITNFHQPESTLFMLICALIGFRNAHETYGFAIESNMRLFSYGDACLFEL